MRLLKDGERPVSGYALVDEAEYLAETLAEALRDPAKLAYYDRAAYDAILRHGLVRGRVPTAAAPLPAPLRAGVGGVGNARVGRVRRVSRVSRVSRPRGRREQPLRVKGKRRPSRAKRDAEVKRLEAQGREAGYNGDSWLRDFARFRWGDQRGQVMDGEPFERVQGRTYWRGVDAEEYVKGNLDGSWAGKGRIPGNGNYYSTSGKTVAEEFMDEGWMYRAKINPKAKVYYEADSSVRRATRDEAWDARFLDDEGRRRAYEGYDAIIVRDPEPYPGEDFLIILNNRALIADARTLPDGDLGKRWRSLLANKVMQAQKEYDEARDAFRKSKTPATRARLQEASEALDAIGDSPTRAEFFKAAIEEMGDAWEGR